MSNDYPHIEFIVTLHCKICSDVTSLQVKMSTNEASQKLKEYIDAHKHESNMWIV